MTRKFSVMRTIVLNDSGCSEYENIFMAGHFLNAHEQDDYKTDWKYHNKATKAPNNFRFNATRS